MSVSLATLMFVDVLLEPLHVNGVKNVTDAFNSTEKAF